MAQDSWKVKPGRRPGPSEDWPIDRVLTVGYQAHKWMLETYRGDPLPRRIQKGRFCTRMDLSRPTVNKYLKGGGIPFPFPPVDHLVWVVDADDHTVRWVSQSLCAALRREAGELVDKDARTVLRGGRPDEAGHFEAVEALKTGAADYHTCCTTFERAGDGYLVPIDIRVSYGELYRVWFVEGQLVGEPTPPSKNGLEHEINTQDVILVDTSINPNYRTTLDPELLRRPIVELNQHKVMVNFSVTPTITCTPGSIVLQSSGPDWFVAPAEKARQAAFWRALSGTRISPTPPCPTCDGARYVNRDWPVTDPEFGVAQPCPACNQQR